MSSADERTKVYNNLKFIGKIKHIVLNNELTIPVEPPQSYNWGPGIKYMEDGHLLQTLYPVERVNGERARHSVYWNTKCVRKKDKFLKASDSPLVLLIGNIELKLDRVHLSESGGSLWYRHEFENGFMQFDFKCESEGDRLNRITFSSVYITERVTSNTLNSQNANSRWKRKMDELNDKDYKKIKTELAELEKTVITLKEDKNEFEFYASIRTIKRLYPMYSEVNDRVDKCHRCKHPARQRLGAVDSRTCRNGHVWNFYPNELSDKLARVELKEQEGNYDTFPTYVFEEADL
jgi:hypothetical protein